MMFIPRGARVFPLTKRLTTPIVALALALLMTGCGPARAPVKTTPPPPPPDASAENLLRNENYLGAAQEFERLYSTTEGVEANRYLMRAVLAYIDGADATTAAGLIPAAPLGDDVAERLRLLATAWLAAIEPSSPAGKAGAALDGIDPRNLTPYQKGVYYRIAAREFSAVNLHEQAIDALIKADAQPVPSASRMGIQRSIWRTMSQLDQATRDRLARDGNQNARAWYELYGGAAPVLHDNTALDQAITSWRQRYPSHRANGDFIETLYEIGESLATRPRHIALLLPFEGRYGPASNAIRNGFLAAWFDDESGVSKPQVSIYSVTSQTVLQQYQVAIERGADLVVGPLEKTTIESLLTYAELTTPLLALNVIDRTLLTQLSADPDRNFSPDRVYQFGLTPEDEAQSVSDKAWRDGVRRVSAIAPGSTFGKRVMDAFVEHWQALGGEVLVPVHYGDDELKYVNAVRQAFNIDLSTARAKKLRAELQRSLVHEPRARRDIEAVFLAGFPVDNRQILPQLKYFGVGGVPIYSTSHTYAGSADPGKDYDLDGMTFGDMPLLLGVAERRATNTIMSGWPRLGASAKRMLAFGWDAYALSLRLARMRYQPGRTLNGLSGILSISPDGQVHRALSFARFVNGVPVSQNASPY